MIKIDYSIDKELVNEYANKIGNIKYELIEKKDSSSSRKKIIRLLQTKGYNEKHINLKDFYEFCYNKNIGSFKDVFDNIDKIETLLVSSFSCLKNNILPKINLGNKKEDFELFVGNIFNYRSYQLTISKFFEKYINPTTCYYCNIDFINVFGQYESVYDFIKNAPIEQFEKIENINEYKSKIEEIQNDRDKFNYEEAEIKNKLNGNFEKVEKYFKASIKTDNGFTLDHVLDKGTHPYFALSIFNLVPSCYTCNSKLKRSESIGANISPSSKDFNFHEKVKFKTYFSTNNKKIQLENPDDIEVFLRDYEEKYKEYIDVFKLNERYRYHRYRVIEMIDKRKRYPDSRIKELADLTGQTSMQVKKDLFSEYLYDDDLSKRPLAKLTRDIAEELGLI